MKRIDLADIISPNFFAVHVSIKRQLCSTVWLKGGRGSTKSSFIAIQIIKGMIVDPAANCLALRKIGNTVRKSIMETFLWAIDILGLAHLFKHTYSPAEITYLPTGQQIIMTGLDDPLKLKSIKIKSGYFKFLWFEEAAEFNGMDELRNVRQSVVRGGDDFVTFISYNPPNDPAAWVNKEGDKEVKDRLTHSSDYRDVPKEWLGKQFILDAEELQRSEPLKYEHEYLGRAVGRAEQIIFHGKWTEKEFDTPDIHSMYQSRFFFGADWGFANDPTTLVRFYIMAEGGEKNLYIDREVGGVGVELDEIEQLFMDIPEAKKWKIYGDCSRPETISHMAQKQFNIEGAPKWKGSVEDGIEYMRSFNNIFIHPSCIRTKEEFIKYSYKVDKNTQDILPVIVEKWDHYIDAIRYGLADYITGEVSILDVL